MTGTVQTQVRVVTLFARFGVVGFFGVCSLLLLWGFGLLLFSSLFFILNKLHPHSSHHTNYTEKKD